MGRVNQILLVLGLSVWVALYSLWHFLGAESMYFLGQSIIMMVASFIMARQNKWSSITIIFFALTTNQFLDEILFYGQSFRPSEYLLIPSILLGLLIKAKATKTNKQ